MHINRLDVRIPSFSRKLIPLYFLLAIFTVVALQVKAQTPYPGCPNISINPVDNTLPVSNDTVRLKCGQTCADLRTSVLQTGNTTKYRVESVNYAPPFPFTGGTGLVVGLDDVYSDALTIPFKFCFFGTAYNQIVVGANGLITFNVAKAGTPNCYAISNPIPNTTNAANCTGLAAGGNGNMVWNSIYGAVHDLDPTEGGSINYSILGTSPCRTFVLNFNDIPHFSCTNLKTTQQIVLYEGTNVIEVYLKSKPSCAGWESGFAVVGIQNSNGTLAYAPPGRNTSAWSATNEAWRFTPDGAPNYVINWLDTTGAVVGTGSGITVCPSKFPAKYITTVEYTNCDGTKIKDRDTITLITDAITGTAANDTIVCEGDTASLAFNTALSGLNYAWSGPGVANPSSAKTKALPTDSTAYIVTVSSQVNPTCQIKDTIIVRVTKTNPGTDGTATLCENSSKINLFPLLGNSPETGGTWTNPAGTAFTNPLDPATASSGDYVYRLKKGVCPAETAKVKVTINKIPNAGNDGLDTMCNSVNNGNLNTIITNQPTGGTWVGLGAAASSVNGSTGIVNVTMLPPANYTYYYVVKGTTPCPNDTAIATLNVKPLPTAAFPPVPAFCLGTSSYLKPVFTGTAPFELIYSDCDGNSYTVANLNNGDSIQITPTTNPCSYTITSVSDGGAYSCTNLATSSQTVTLYTAPNLQLDSLSCNTINTGYKAYITLSGGDQNSYTINNAATGITGTKFESTLQSSGSSYNFVVSDKNGCTPKNFTTGIKTCNCSTDAGTMQAVTIDVCGSTAAVATPNGDENLDGNDVKMYILHDNSGVSLGRIIDINTSTPSFTYNAAWGIQYDQLYYISTVVGDPDPSNAAIVDTTNPTGCMEVATGQPVAFHEIPNGSATINPTQICVGDNADIIFSYSAGKEPYDFDMQYNGNISTIYTRTAVNNKHTVSPTTLGINTYTLTQITDQFGCTNTINIPLQVTAVDAPDTVNVQTACNPINTAYTVSFDIINGNPTGYTVNNIPFSGTSYVSSPVPSGQSYQYDVADNNLCSVVIVGGKVTCPCISNAGTMVVPQNAIPLEFCEYSPATVLHNGDQTLDPNDTISFILCADISDPIGTRLQMGKTPSFSMIGVMTTGTTYYICPIAGDMDPASGLVDIASFCKNIGSGTPVKFIAIPRVSLLGTTEICQNGSTPITITVTGNDTVTFDLVSSDGLLQTLRYPTGVHSYTVTPNQPFGLVKYSVDSASVIDDTQPVACFGDWTPMDTVSVLVHPTPSAILSNLSGPDTICTGEQVKIRFQITGDAPLTISYKLDNQSNLNFNATKDTSIIITNNLTVGPHTYTLVSIRDNTLAQCPGTTNGQADIVVHEIPTATLSLTKNEICFLDSTEVELIVTKGTNPAFKVYYHQTFNSGIVKYAQVNLPNGSSKFKVLPAATGTYSYQLDSITDNTISDTSHRSCHTTYTSVSAPPQQLVVRVLPTSKMFGDTGVCMGSNSGVHFQSTGDFKLIASYDIQTDQTGVPSSGTFEIDSTDKYMTVLSSMLKDSTTFILTNIVEAGPYGCVGTVSGQATINVYDIPVPIIGASDSSSCPPLLTTVLNLTDPKFLSNQNGLGSYSWDFGNGNTAMGVGPDPGNSQTYTEPDSYTLTLSITSPNGCSATTTANNLLIVYPFPAAEFNWSPNPTTIIETTEFFRNLSSGNAENYWTFYDKFGTLLDSSTDVNPSYKFPDLDTGSYPVKLLVSTEFGCLDSIEHVVIIGGVFEVYIPNTFTPNKDGVNDVFLPILLGEAPQSYELSIFNRWGERIFYSTNYKEGWDGTYQGADAREDVYVYHLKIRSRYNAEKKDLKGAIRMLK